MKQIIQNYTFNAAARTVTFNDFSQILLERVLVVTNVTAGVVLYIFSTPEKGGSATGNVLTLDYDTTKMNNGDKLQITYDCTATDPMYSTYSYSALPVASKVTTLGNITYIATASPGSSQSDAVWRVKKIDETSGITITWADGNTNFDNVATDLPNLNYS